MNFLRGKRGEFCSNHSEFSTLERISGGLKTVWEQYFTYFERIFCFYSVASVVF